MLVGNNDNQVSPFRGQPAAREQQLSFAVAFSLLLNQGHLN